MGQRSDFITLLRSKEGYAEGPKDNETIFGKHTKHDFQPWCGSFGDWGRDQIGFKAPSTVSTTAAVAAFKKDGKFQDLAHAVPELGDYVYMGFDPKNPTAVQHVGYFVKDNLDGTWVLIEGNTTSDKKTGSQDNGGEVALKVRGVKSGNKRGKPVFIIGIGKPDFND